MEGGGRERRSGENPRNALKVTSPPGSSSSSCFLTRHTMSQSTPPQAVRASFSPSSSPTSHTTTSTAHDNFISVPSDLTTHVYSSSSMERKKSITVYFLLRCAISRVQCRCLPLVFFSLSFLFLFIAAGENEMLLY